MTAPVLMANLAPCQGQVTSAPSTVPSDSGPPRWVHVSLSAWNASPTRKRAIFWPSTSTCLACWSSNSSVVATFMNLGIAPSSLLWVGSVFDRSFLQPLPPGSPASVLVVQGLTPGLSTKNCLFSAMKCFHCSGVSSSTKIAFTGHTGSQAPQSIHSSGWMKRVRPLVDAVHRADLDAGLVLDVDARLGDHVRHGDLPL